MNGLPDELVIYVFTKLTAKELSEASKVCRRWNRLVGDRAVWQSVSARLAAQSPEQHGWKEAVRSRCEASAAQLQAHREEIGRWMQDADAATTWQQALQTDLEAAVSAAEEAAIELAQSRADIELLLLLLRRKTIECERLAADRAAADRAASAATSIAVQAVERTHVHQMTSSERAGGSSKPSASSIQSSTRYGYDGATPSVLYARSNI